MSINLDDILVAAVTISLYQFSAGPEPVFLRRQYTIYPGCKIVPIGIEKQKFGNAVGIKTLLIDPDTNEATFQTFYADSILKMIESKALCII
jgi:hypothetical protein